MKIKELNPNEIWELSAKGVHDNNYQVKYIEALVFLIRNKEMSILDTAAGSGFPAINLFNAGFKNIEALDADSQAVAKLRKKFKNQKVDIQIFEGLWQDLSKKTKKIFDVIINVDNSFVYMDGWSEDRNIVCGFKNIYKRIALVLKNFYKLLSKNGFIIIGLGKHYDPAMPIEERKKIHNRTFNIIENNIKICVKWETKIDWDKTRILDLTIRVQGKGIKGIAKKKAYLITKDELVDIMKEVGFKTVYILCPDRTRDNFIIGIK